MKKLLFAVLCAACFMNTAFAQKKAIKATHTAPATTTAVRANAGVNASAQAFHQKTAEMKAALNANDFTKAEGMWLDVHHMMAKRGDEIRKLDSDVPGSDKHYVLADRLKLMGQNIAGNKAGLLQLLNEMDAAF